MIHFAFCSYSHVFVFRNEVFCFISVFRGLPKSVASLSESSSDYLCIDDIGEFPALPEPRPLVVPQGRPISSRERRRRRKREAQLALERPDVSDAQLVIVICCYSVYRGHS